MTKAYRSTEKQTHKTPGDKGVFVRFKHSSQSNEVWINKNNVTALIRNDSGDQTTIHVGHGYYLVPYTVDKVLEMLA